MSVLAEWPDFEYGNARLRARKPSLLGRADYEGLLGRGLEALLGALSETAYGPDLEEAAARLRGLAALERAVGQHLARSLEEMRAFYSASARALVDLLLSGWDLHNLLTLVRGQAVGSTPDETVASLAPLGAIHEAAAMEVARQSDMGRAVELLRSWCLPTPRLARALGRAFPAYLRNEDLAALEQSLMAEHFRSLVEALAELGDEAGPLEREVSREAEVRNVLAALRLRQVADDGATERSSEPPFVPGGRLRTGQLRAAIEAAGDAEAASALAEAMPYADLREALERWAPEQGLVALQADLEAHRTRAAIALFGSGDPLGAAVPIAFAAAKASEARNLRMIGAGAARGAAPGEVSGRLVLPEQPGG